MVILYFLSLSVFALYIGYILIRFGVPTSVSETYYLLPKKTGHLIFWAWTIAVGLPVMIFGAEISPVSFISESSIFFCGAFLIFVGTAAQFKQDFVRNYHFAFAGICAALSLIWIGFTYIQGLKIVVILTPISVLLGAYIPSVNADDKVKRNSLVFFLELVCFVSLYGAMGLYYWK